MLKLDMKPGLRWLDLGQGVSVQVKPATTQLMMAARKDQDLLALPDDADDEQVGYVFAKALARRAIVDWKGVVGQDGKKLAVSDDAVDALMETWWVFEQMQSQYLVPAVEVESEKNGSAPLPSGSTAGAKTTAKPARARARTARKK